MKRDEKVRRDAREDRSSLPKLEEEGGKDIDAKRRRLRQHLEPFFGEMPLSKVSSFDLERYKKQRLKETASPAARS